MNQPSLDTRSGRPSSPPSGEKREELVDCAAMPRQPLLGVVGGSTQGIGQAEEGEREDQPLRRIEVVPAWAIAVIALIAMVVVMVAFAKGQ